jgi:hypothetical protein
MSKGQKYEKYIIYDDSDSESESYESEEEEEEDIKKEKKISSKQGKNQEKKQPQTQPQKRTYRKRTKPTAAQLKQAEMLKELEELKAEFTKLKSNGAQGKSRISTQGHTIKQTIIKDENDKENDRLKPPFTREESIIKSDFIRF